MDNTHNIASSSPSTILIPSAQTPSPSHSHSSEPTPTQTPVPPHFTPHSPVDSESGVSSSSLTSSTPSSSTAASECGEGDRRSEEQGLHPEEWRNAHLGLNAHTKESVLHKALSNSQEGIEIVAGDGDDEEDSRSDIDSESTLSDYGSNTLDSNDSDSGGERRLMFGYPLERMARPGGEILRVALDGVIDDSVVQDQHQGHDRSNGESDQTRLRGMLGRRRGSSADGMSEKEKQSQMNIARYLGSLSGKSGLFGTAGRNSEHLPPAIGTLPRPHHYHQEQTQVESSAYLSPPHSRFHTHPHTPPSEYTSIPGHAHAARAGHGMETPPVVAHLGNLVGFEAVRPPSPPSSPIFSPSTATSPPALHSIIGHQYSYLPSGLSPAPSESHWLDGEPVPGEGTQPVIYVKDPEQDHEYVPGCPGCAQMKTTGAGWRSVERRSSSESEGERQTMDAGVWDRHSYRDEYDHYDVEDYESIIDELIAENPSYLQSPPSEMILVDPSSPHSADAFMIKCLPLTPTHASAESPAYTNMEYQLLNKLNDSPTVRRDPWNPIPHLLCAVKRHYEYYVDEEGGARKEKKTGATVFLCMERLVNFDEPPFPTVSNYIDFFKQVLEGLTFLHEKQIALGSCADPYGYMVDLSSGAAGRFSQSDSDILTHSASDALPPNQQQQQSSQPHDYYKDLISTFDRTMLPVKYYFTDLSRAQKVNVATHGHAHSTTSNSSGTDHPLLRQDVKDCAVFFEKLVDRMTSSCSGATPIATPTSPHPQVPRITQITSKLRSLISSMHSGTFGADNSRNLMEAMCKSLDGRLFGLTVDGTTGAGDGAEQCLTPNTATASNSPIRRASAPSPLPSQQQEQTHAHHSLAPGRYCQDHHPHRQGRSRQHHNQDQSLHPIQRSHSSGSSYHDSRPLQHGRSHSNLLHPASAANGSMWDKCSSSPWTSSGQGRICRSGPGSGAVTPSGLRESVNLSDLLG